MAGALTHDPITVGGGLHQTPSGGVQTSQDGRVRALSSSQTEAAAKGSPPRYAIGIGLLGDSITNNGYYTDAASPDGATVSAYWVDGATNNNARGMGWSTWVGPMSMQRIRS